MNFSGVLFTAKQFPLLNTATQRTLQAKLLLYILQEVSYRCVDYVQ